MLEPPYDTWVKPPPFPLTHPWVALKKYLVFLCSVAWWVYKLPDQEVWPLNGILNYNTIL
jgi:hypothetical protein